MYEVKKESRDAVIQKPVLPGFVILQIFLPQFKGRYRYSLRFAHQFFPE